MLGQSQAEGVYGVLIHGERVVVKLELRFLLYLLRQTVRDVVEVDTLLIIVRLLEREQQLIRFVSHFKELCDLIGLRLVPVGGYRIYGLLCSDLDLHELI